jgi:glycosyltransferase involved in cell wall biosynthesis
LRIGFILCEHPLDVRIKKEARSLSKAGHEIIALVQRRETNQKLIKEDSLAVQFYDPLPSNGLRDAITFVNRMLFLPIPVEPLIRKFAIENKVDVLHIHDLPNVGAGIRVARQLGIPVVADLHENYPAAVRAWVGRLKPSHLISTNQTLWHNYQKRCVHRANKVITVVEELRNVILSYGVEPEKVHVVPNYVDLDYLRSYARVIEPMPGYENRFIVSYVGFTGPDRGVDVAIKAISLVAKQAPEILLLVVGDAGLHKTYQQTLQQLVADLRLQNFVKLVGWQPFENIPRYLAVSSIGLVPHLRNPHRDNTIPNKLFDYMGFGKPVVVSDCPPLARIVRTANCGLVCKAGQPNELAECILQLFYNHELRARYGANGASAVQNYYNWENASKELVRVYECLANSRPQESSNLVSQTCM